MPVIGKSSSFVDVKLNVSWVHISVLTGDRVQSAEESLFAETGADKDLMGWFSLICFHILHFNFTAVIFPSLKFSAVKWF